MGSGSSPLANRLVEAATNAADQSEVEVFRGRRLARADLRHMSEASTVAVLRMLAYEFDGVAPDECHPTDTLLRLADEIEKGE